ncbi:hypothetical protein Hanom_Chr13g01219611 [Helianthus anomalus]
MNRKDSKEKPNLESCRKPTVVREGDNTAYAISVVIIAYQLSEEARVGQVEALLRRVKEAPERMQEPREDGEEGGGR